VGVGIASKAYAASMPSLLFADRLFAAIDAARSPSGCPACVGLDPVVDRLPASLQGLPPAEAIERFCVGVLEAMAGGAEGTLVVPAIKPQSACFERHGSAGMAALERTIARASDLGFVVILDAKRGDIGISANHYAAAAANMGAHAITVNGYLGPETIEPYLDAGLGVFVLVRTSNAGSDAVQSVKLDDGRTVAEMMAHHVAQLGERFMGDCGLSSVGAVVGATKPDDARAMRAAMPNQFFLVPGFGAQGGTVETVRGLLDARGGGVLVTASRSVIYPHCTDGEDWQQAIRRAASAFADEVRTLAP
jgi:orotidine-5'-phosphate decarboxylase